MSVPSVRPAPAVHPLQAAPGESAALTLATGMNNTSAAAALAGSQFSGHPAVLLPIFFYGLAQQLLAAAVPAVLRPRPRFHPRH